MDSFFQFVRNLGPARLAAIGGIAVLLMAFFIFLTTRLSTPNMSLLYGDIDQAEADKIVGQLSQQNIPFELRGDGREILVPADKVAELRLSLAKQGLSGSVVGYEIFDKDQAIGTSTFIQQLNRSRALEGELSRTIASIEGVKGARVHLVMPRRELFSRETRAPSASIIIKMRGAQRLSRDQVSAIQQLVATAVPDLQPNHISIVDDRGTLLAKGAEGDGNTAADNVEEMQISYENRLARKIEELLQSTVGYGKVRAEVRAEMDASQTVINEEQYDPNGQVLRSSVNVEQQSSSSDGSSSAVTVGNNLPDANALDGSSGSKEAETKTEERSNYEISKTVKNTVITPGQIKRLSIAVLVDGNYKETTAPDGSRKTEYVPRTPEEMKQIEALVKSAVGYDEAGRGDTIEVVNMQFAELPVSGEAEVKTYFGFTTADIKRLLEVLVLAVVGLLVILLVVRPLIAKVFEAAPSAVAAAAGGGDTALLTDQSAEAQAILAGMDEGQREEEFDSMIDIAHIEGRVKASSMKKIGEIIEKHPEEAVSILRNWMYQDSN